MLGQQQQKDLGAYGRGQYSNCSCTYSNKAYAGTFGPWAHKGDGVITAALQY